MGMCWCNPPLLAIDTSDVILYVDSVSSESVLDRLVVSGCELMELIVRVMNWLRCWVILWHGGVIDACEVS